MEINYSCIFIFILSVISAFFEHQQHKEHRAQYPDIKPCPSGVIGYVLIAVIALVRGIFP